jgi:hypothetical protein
MHLQWIDFDLVSLTQDERHAQWLDEEFNFVEMTVTDTKERALLCHLRIPNNPRQSRPDPNRTL